jgi:hypothetical protein
MRWFLPLPFFFWAPVAAAQESVETQVEIDTSVFILPPNPRDSELSEIGRSLDAALVRQLKRRRDLSWIPMDAVGMIHDVPAALYASSCPMDEIIGCAYVLGDRGGADYAVASHLVRVDGGHQVQVHLIDVAEAEAAFSFQLDLEEGKPDAYGEGVARLLHSLSTGKLGQKEDIREVVISDRDEAIRKNQEAAEDLQVLASELGDVSTLSQRSHGKIERPRISEEDLLRKAQSDGVKPWERLDMTAREFVRYSNSGLSLRDWKVRSRGRKNQLLIRPQLGGGRVWADSRYHGQVLSSDETLQALETWAWQAQVIQPAVSSSLCLAYGLTPELEIGLRGGAANGTLTVQIDRAVLNQSSTEGAPFEYPTQTWEVGGYVRASALPDWTVRPSVGAGISWWWGSRVSDHDLNLPPAELPDFDPVRFMVASITPGVEARLSDTVDVVWDVPVHFRVGGVTQREEWAGIDEGMELEPVADVARLGFAVHVGLQIRLFGKQRISVSLDDYED